VGRFVTTGYGMEDAPPRDSAAFLNGCLIPHQVHQNCPRQQDVAAAITKRQGHGVTHHVGPPRIGPLR
jgi:hypothetical protein